MRQLRWALSGFLLLSVLLSASAWADEYTSEEQRLLEAYHSGELLRLHILADNDAPEAQQLKLAVRDAILSRFAAELNEATTADEAFARLCSLLPQMEAVAADTVQRAGFDLPVSAEAGVLSLPEKRYGRWCCRRATIGGFGSPSAAAKAATGGASCFRSSVWLWRMRNHGSPLPPNLLNCRLPHRPSFSGTACASCATGCSCHQRRVLRT